MAGEVGRIEYIQGKRRQEQKEILLPGDVPLPQRELPAHGARKELCDRRCNSKIQEDAGLQCALSNGL